MLLTVMMMMMMSAPPSVDAVLQLTVENFEAMTAGKSVFIKFFAPWYVRTYVWMSGAAASHTLTIRTGGVRMWIEDFFLQCVTCFARRRVRSFLHARSLILLSLSLSRALARIVRAPPRSFPFSVV